MDIGDFSTRARSPRAHAHRAMQNNKKLSVERKRPRKNKSRTRVVGYLGCITHVREQMHCRARYHDSLCTHCSPVRTCSVGTLPSETSRLCCRSRVRISPK
ncbi:unnamed protein product [Ectocarpus sp. 13 AM-2016]